jgi:serine/threonine protein kinase
LAEVFPTIPGYQILKQMGQGGMATVYLAVQESFGRQVALKIMSDQLGKDDVWAQRFMHEARVVAQLSHSNIVPVFDVGSHEGRFYISMELLKGGKLDEKASRQLSVPDIVKITSGVAAGLDYAGSKGFVHRDIKPDNIMFRDDGTPVILDFGIAKQKDGDSKMTKTGTIVGTTGYMSPEQAMGIELDERSDLYSLGIMFYELLTGHVPFRGDSAVAVLLKHVQETPAPLPAALSVFQPALDKALAKKPQDRYTRGSEMVEHLQELLVQFKTNTIPQQKMISSTDATIVTAPVTGIVEAKTTNRLPLIATIAVIVVGVLAYAGMLLLDTAQNKTDIAAADPASKGSVKEAPVAATAVNENSGNKRAIERMLSSADECLKQHKYDCAKSKAEAALDLDPDNALAKQIIASAKKAQKDAFSGDWNAN